LGVAGTNVAGDAAGDPCTDMVNAATSMMINVANIVSSQLLAVPTVH
jgi:Na+/H+-translocating membrane pyrophosphatase